MIGKTKIDSFFANINLITNKTNEDQNGAAA